MPARKKQSRPRLKVNLLPKSNFEESFLGKIISWMLGTFRLIVILVELVVIGGFAARFYLDMRHSSLNDQIKQKLAIIQEYQEFESKFRRIQTKQEIYTDATSDQYTFSPTIQMVVKNLPSDIKLSSIQKNGGIYEIRGAAASEQSIAQFLVNLKQEQNLSNLTIVSLESVDNSALIGFTFKNQPIQDKLN